MIVPLRNVPRPSLSLPKTEFGGAFAHEEFAQKARATMWNNFNSTSESQHMSIRSFFYAYMLYIIIYICIYIYIYISIYTQDASLCQCTQHMTGSNIFSFALDADDRVSDLS